MICLLQLACFFAWSLGDVVFEMLLVSSLCRMLGIVMVGTTVVDS